MKVWGTLYIVGHCIMAGVAFAVLKWWDGLIGFIPIVSEIYLTIRFFTTSNSFLGIMCIVLFLLFFISCLADRKIKRNLETNNDNNQKTDI